MDPLSIYKGHSSVVGDVCWHNLQEHIFASVGDDRMMLVCVFEHSPSVNFFILTLLVLILIVGTQGKSRIAQYNESKMHTVPRSMQSSLALPMSISFAQDLATR
jgi:hypothetical protein